MSADFAMRAIGWPRLLVALAGLLVSSGCIDGEREPIPVLPGADVRRGHDLVYGYTCGGCHVIPGVSQADGTVGPPLTDWTERSYIAGAIWNTPENLVLWLRDPQAIEPGTAMPNMGISEPDARDMAAYLFTLGDRRPLGPPHPFPVEWLEGLMPGH